MQTLKQSNEELDYSAYQERQYGEISKSGLETRALSLGIGGRASYSYKRWTPLSYPGFALQAMLSESSQHESLSLELQEIQKRIDHSIGREGVLYPLPAPSFHQTVANTFSADRLRRHVIDNGILDTFPSIIENALNDWKKPDAQRPVSMRLIGLSLFRTAIGALGVFESRSDFERVIEFRDFFYGHPKLEAIGLTRTRPFIGHVTLNYVEDSLSGYEKQCLINQISRINEDLSGKQLVMQMPIAKLHRYDNLSAFITNPQFPSALL